MDFLNLLNITWTPLNILLITIFFGLVAVGFYIIYRDVKIIKEKQITKQDYFFSTIYGIIFAASLMLGILVVVQYSSLARLPSWLAPPSTEIHFPRFTTILFLFLLGVTIAYPFLEFMFMAFQVKQSSPFMYQDTLYKKFISRMKGKTMKVVAGTICYGAIFVAIPVFLQLALNVPLIIGAVTIFQAFPVFLLSKLGANGFFWGINLHFYNIFEKDRFMYTLFDDGEKALAQFKETPIPIIAVPGMVYVYINTYISLVTMILDPLIGQLAAPGFTFLFSTFTNVTIALVGYYNKFWKKEVKYKPEDILFAGYIFASLSVNILLTFLVKSPGILLQDLSVVFSGELTTSNYLLLLPAAMIQRVVFGVVITYYAIKGGKYKQNVLDSIIVQASNRLNPRFLFNFLRHSNPHIREAAARQLDEMYRIHSMKYVPPPAVAKKKNPLKSLVGLLGRAVLSPKRKQAPFKTVFDALSSDYIEVRAFATKLFQYMLADDPEQTITMINAQFQDPDNVKAAYMLDVVPFMSPAALDLLNLGLLVDKVANGDLELRSRGFKILALVWKRIMQTPALLEKSLAYIIDAVQSPCNSLQASCLEFLSEIDTTMIVSSLPVKKLLGKIDHPSPKIKEQAVVLLDKVLSSALDESQLTMIVRLMDDKNPGIRLAALKSLLAISERTHVDVPVETLTNLLKSEDRNIVVAAARLMARLINQDQKKYRLSLIFTILETDDAMLIANLLQDLGDIITEFPDDFLPLLGRILERPSIELKEIAKKYLVFLGKTHFEKVLERILNVKEDSRFAVRNFTREILVEIGKLVPDRVIPLLQAVLIPERVAAKNFGTLIPFIDNRSVIKAETIKNENFRANAAAIIGDLGELFPGKINYRGLLECLKTEESWRVRRDLAVSVGKLMARIDDFPVEQYAALFSDTNPNVRGALAKGLLELAKQKPGGIRVEQISDKIKDADDIVRETIIRVIGYLGIKRPDESMPFLVAGLKDDKWPVKNAAVEAMSMLVETIPDKIPTGLLKTIMLTDKDKWSRWQAARTLSKVVKVVPGAVRMQEMAGKVDIADENMIIAYLELLRNVESESDTIFINAIEPLMNSSNIPVQEQVVLTIYTVHGKTRSEGLLSALLKMVIDKDTPLHKRHAAAIALGKIAKYDTGEIRKRVRKVLGSQCQQLRDPVICNEFTALD
nr:HEAT repeat domain-containing protein [Candidatus Sigynarchaeota archaeon]